MARIQVFANDCNPDVDRPSRYIPRHLADALVAKGFATRIDERRIQLVGKMKQDTFRPRWRTSSGFSRG